MLIRNQSIKKTVLSIALVLLCAFSIGKVAKAESDSGSCGVNATWTFENGTLTISGTGEMENFQVYYEGDGTVPYLQYMKQIETVVIEEGITGIGDYAFYDCDLLKIVEIPDTVTTMGYCAFSDCDLLDDPKLPASLTSIGYCAFSDCQNLTKITIPRNVTSIEGGAFSGCSKLKIKDLPYGITSIGYGAFTRCNSIVDINIPDSVTTMEPCCFYNCEGLVNIHLSNQLTEIQNETFKKCYNLESIKIPNSVKSIGEEAFYFCSGLKSIGFSDGLLTIGKEAFYGCEDLTIVEIPDSVISLESGAFSNCIGLISVKLSAFLTNIQSSVFSNCSKLEYVDIPDSVTSIGYGMFARCTSLQSIKLPTKLTTIKSYAFVNCEKLESIEIPDSVIIIEERAFEECKELKSVKLSALLNRIEEGVFSECGWLKTIIIPDGVTSIGENAFINCYSLTDVSIPDSVKNIGRGAFWGCNRLTCVIIPDGMATIERETFFDCTRLINVFIPNTITKIEEYAFTYCENITDVYYSGSEEEWEQIDKGYNYYITEDHATVHFNFSLNSKTGTAINLFRNGKVYNLIKDEQTFPEGDEETVSLFVSLKWGGSSHGSVSLVQNGKTISENTNGRFLNIMPGKLFEPSGSIYVVQKDADQNEIERKKIKLYITGNTKSRRGSKTKKNSFVVFQNKNVSTKKEDKYVLSADVDVEVDGLCIKTDKAGKVSFKIPDTGDTTFSKKDYISRTFSPEQLENNCEIYLQKVNNDGPVISGVWVDNIDILNTEYVLSMVSTERITLKPEIDWGKSTPGDIYLYQDENTAYFWDDTLSIVISDYFDASKTIYIVAKDNAGHITKRPLQFENGESKKVLNKLNGIKFDFGDSLSVTLPKDFNPDILAGKKISVDVSSIVPITIAADRGKIYVAIGFDLNSRSYKKTSTKKKPKDETHNFIKDFKKSGIFDTSDFKEGIDDLKNLKKLYNDSIKKPAGHFGFEADFTLLGFFEGTYDQNGKITWLDRGLIANPSLGVNWDWPLAPPIYGEAFIKGDILARMNIIMNEEAKKFLPLGDISGKITGGGGPGIGVKGVLSASGGIEIELEPLYKIIQDAKDYFRLDASVGGYLKVCAGPATIPIKFKPFPKATIVELPKKSKSVTQAENSVWDSEEIQSIYDMGAYQLKDLSYLADASVFYGNGNVGPKKTKGSKDGESQELGSSEVLKTNIYRESSPQIATFADGTKLAVWIDGESSDMNQVYLNYSVYEDGIWSDPQIVCQDGTMDFAPSLEVIGDTAYLAWQNATKEFDSSEDLGLEDIAEYFDISTGVFNRETKAFATSTITREHLDLMPALCGSEEEVYAVWINNAANDWFGGNEQNTILFSRFDGNSWSDSETAYSGLQSIGSIAVDYNEGLNIAYNMDTDGDLNTVDDQRVYENGVQVDGEDAAYNPMYFNHELYWFANKNVVNASTAGKEGTCTFNNCQLLQVDGKKAMIYISHDGLKSSVKIAYYNSETDEWGEGVALTDGSDFIGEFDIATDQDGFVILANRVEVTGNFESEDPYGAASLALVSSEPAYNLSLDEVFYNQDQFCAGAEMPLDLAITNKGNTVVSGTTVTIKTPEGTVLSTSTIEDMIAPGETLETSILYDVPVDTTGQELVFSIAPVNGTDTDTSDNEQSIKLSFEEVYVEDIEYGYMEEDGVAISSSIVNRGYHERNGLSVSLVKGSADGEVIETQNIDSIEPMDIYEATFILDSEPEEVLYLVVKDSDGEEIDSDYVVFYQEDTAPAEHEHIKETTITPATLTADGSIVEKCSECGEELSKKTISKIKIIKLAKTKVVYNGKAQKPAVTITDAKGNTISKDYYKVSWSSGCKNPGLYKATINFSGHYEGSKSLSYTIIPKPTTISSVKAASKALTVKWKKQATQTTGYEIQYATNSKFTAGKKTVTIKSSKTVSKKITGLKAKKKYYVRIRTYKTVSGKKYYSSWSKAKATTTK